MMRELNFDARMEDEIEHEKWMGAMTINLFPWRITWIYSKPYRIKSI
jgi:hypothetical protein